MASKKTQYVPAWTEPVPVTRPSTEERTKAPVDKQVSSSVNPQPADSMKTSLSYKIDDLDGQKIREWFKEDFGAHRTIELNPKLKSEQGFFKGKITVDPSDKAHINILEEVEIQTVIDGKEAQFKVKPREISAVFDLGLRQVGNHWLNPYIGVSVPRSSSSLRGANSTRFGFLFHHDRSLASRLRTQLELIVQQADPEKKLRTEIDVKANISFAYRNLILGLYESWSLTNSFERTSKLSLSAKEKEFSGFAQLELVNSFDLAGVLLGASYSARKNLTIFGQASKNLCIREEPPALGLGLEWQHCSGFGAKLAYHHKNKVASVFNFLLNKNITASLMFDKGCCRPDGKNDFSWGAKIKANL